MPCADGELCHQQDRTPQAPHGHVCQGGCGGRLHGNCGSMFDDHETKRICSTCVAKAGKRKATPAEGAGAGPSKRPKKTKGGSREGSGSRARPDNNTKLEILKLMDAKVSYAQIADRFGCSVRFLATVRSDRKQIEAAAAAGGGSQKTARKGDFPEVSYINTLLAGTHVSIGGEEEDEQQQGSGDENTGRERRAPPAYDELSSHFGVLEAAAEESGNGDAAFYLTKAKMAMIAAHSAKRVRQADMREFFVT